MKTIGGIPLKEVQERFCAALPRIERHAKVFFRGRKDRDEMIQESICNAWKGYCLALEGGSNPDEFISVIAMNAVKHTRGFRSITRMHSTKDVLSPRARQTAGFSVSGDEALEGLADTHVSTPADQAAFLIDTPEWLKQLLETRRAMAEDMMIGETTSALARKYGRSPARISQIRQELHDDYQAFHER